MFIINILRNVYNYCFRRGDGGSEGRRVVSQDFLSPDNGRTSRYYPTPLVPDDRRQGEHPFQLLKKNSKIFPTHCWLYDKPEGEAQAQRQCWNQICHDVRTNTMEWHYHQKKEHDRDMQQITTVPISAVRALGRQAPRIPGLRVRFGTVDHVNVVQDPVAQELVIEEEEVNDHSIRDIWEDEIVEPSEEAEEVEEVEVSSVVQDFREHAVVQEQLVEEEDSVQEQLVEEEVEDEEDEGSLQDMVWEPVEDSFDDDLSGDDKAVVLEEEDEEDEDSVQDMVWEPVEDSFGDDLSDEDEAMPLEEMEVAEQFLSQDFLSTDGGRTSLQLPSPLAPEENRQGVELFQLQTKKKNQDPPAIYPTHCWLYYKSPEEVQAQQEAISQIGTDSNSSDREQQEERELIREMERIRSNPDLQVVVERRRFGRAPVPGQRVNFSPIQHVNIVQDPPGLIEDKQVQEQDSVLDMSWEAVEEDSFDAQLEENADDTAAQVQLPGDEAKNYSVLDMSWEVEEDSIPAPVDEKYLEWLCRPITDAEIEAIEAMLDEEEDAEAFLFGEEDSEGEDDEVVGEVEVVEKEEDDEEVKVEDEEVEVEDEEVEVVEKDEDDEEVKVEDEEVEMVEKDEDDEEVEVVEKEEEYSVQVLQDNSATMWSKEVEEDSVQEDEVSVRGLEEQESATMSKEEVEEVSVRGLEEQESATISKEEVEEDSVEEQLEERDDDDEEDFLQQGDDGGGGNQVVVRRQPLRRSARIAALAPPRRSRRLAAMPRVSYKGMC